MVVHDAGRVVGYYGLAPSAVVASVRPRRVRTGQAPDPIPCLLLGQLATDRSCSGQGVGTGLLKHALMRCVAGARLTLGRALVVHALDEQAGAFWRRRGFLPSKDEPLTPFRSRTSPHRSNPPAEEAAEPDAGQAPPTARLNRGALPCGTRADLDCG
jgi:hypothetical protein